MACFVSARVANFSVCCVPVAFCAHFSGETRMTKRYGLLLLLLVFALPADGQSNYTVLSGSVTDLQRLPIAGAAVQLTAASTGAIRRVVTNQQGVFEAPALLPDDYELRIEASGFAI